MVSFHRGFPYPEHCVYFSGLPTSTTCPPYVVSLEFDLLTDVFQLVQIMKLYTVRFSLFPVKHLALEMDI